MVMRPFPALTGYTPPRMRWPLRLAFFLVAVGVAVLSLSQLMVTPWWMRAGFVSDPGNFITKNQVGYSVCAPWPSKDAGRVAETRAVAAPGRTVDVGVLLPPGAQVLSITCGVSLNGARPVPCLPDRCIIPLAVTLDDDTYKHGRGLVLTALNKSPNLSADVTFRVAWR